MLSSGVLQKLLPAHKRQLLNFQAFAREADTFHPQVVWKLALVGLFVPQLLAVFYKSQGFHCTLSGQSVKWFNIYQHLMVTAIKS